MGWSVSETSGGTGEVEIVPQWKVEMERWKTNLTLNLMGHSLIRVTLAVILPLKVLKVPGEAHLSIAHREKGSPCLPAAVCSMQYASTVISHDLLRYTPVRSCGE